MSKIPIIILTMDRPIQFRDMMEALEARTDMDLVRVVVCDNGSTQPEMIEYLKTLESRHRIIYNGSNMIFKGLNPALETVNEDYFIITDPDIIIGTEISKDWPVKTRELLEEQKDVPKTGLSLDINFQASTPLTNKIRFCEDAFWKSVVSTAVVPDVCYYAMTDTTMCMYRRDTFSFWDGSSVCFTEGAGIADGRYITQDMYNVKYPRHPIRMAGRFTAKHAGWYVDAKYLPDLEYYKARSNNIVASTIREMYDLIKAHHGIA